MGNYEEYIFNLLSDLHLFLAPAALDVRFVPPLAAETLLLPPPNKEVD